jgi:hypothetical protein
MLLDIDFLFKVTGCAGGVVRRHATRCLQSYRLTAKGEAEREAFKQEAKFDWQIFPTCLKPAKKV